MDAKIGVDPAENDLSEVVILRSDSGVSTLRAMRGAPDADALVAEAAALVARAGALDEGALTVPAR